MDNALIRLLRENARFTHSQLAAMLDTTSEEVEKRIAKLEKDGVIKGYKVLLDYEKLDEESVVAMIEVKVTPQRKFGFDDIAGQISGFPEVDSVYLMSGAYDLALMVEARTFKDIAVFVQQKLALLDSVTSTATHFVLVRYKEKGVVLCDTDADDRERALL